MFAKQVIQERAAAIEKITQSLVAQAASSLIKGAARKSDLLSPEEVNYRLEKALTALNSKSPYQIGEEMLSSYKFDRKNGVSGCTVPAGIEDIPAIVATIRYANKYFSHVFNGGKAFLSKDLLFYKTLDQRDFPENKARKISIVPLVPKTARKSRGEEESMLHAKKLVLSDPRDQLILGILHACAFKGEDLYQGKEVRCSVPEATLYLTQNNGFAVGSYRDSAEESFLAASGTPLQRKRN